jgi:hypothetical protein
MESPKHHAANCKWARPTLQEPNPIWLAAEERPWSCERDGTPRPLESTEPCEDCPEWTASAPDED